VLVLYTEAQLTQAYQDFLEEVSSLMIDGHDMGNVPTLEEFRIIYEEEQASL
tara:strand:+ start:396 stop:551 length:156 start_codon:yes stop_codon:yes gene_type:complete